jgi:hypothetical protein
MMIKVGDVFQIKTSIGEAYFQYTKKNPTMGSLIRVLPGTYSAEEVNLKELVDVKTNFWIFFPVGAALKRGIIKKAGHFPIPEHSLEAPTFRAGVTDPLTKRVETWWFWDGMKEWKVGEINVEQRKFPIRGSWNDTLLIQRIEEGWLPEKDPR